MGVQARQLLSTVTVNPTPTVNSITNATYCNGAAAAAINFSKVRQREDQLLTTGPVRSNVGLRTQRYRKYPGLLSHQCH